ncbi:MAG: ECF transporter S component [Lachnospiraceae bacterium]|nr:ECF transporter S component [Lachnospiraceae bacterium]
MKKTNQLTLAAMFFTIGLILPFLIGQIPAIGQMLLPMHIPVLLCGLIVGWKYGFAVGFLLPLMRGVLFGMPVLFPNGVAMAFELGTYGLVAGFLYGRSRWQCVRALYRSLIAAMITGRLVWGVVRTLLILPGGGAFTWSMFLAGALLNAVPGIILQLILIPAIMVALNRAKIVPFHKEASLRTEAGRRS